MPVIQSFRCDPAPVAPFVPNFANPMGGNLAAGGGAQFSFENLRAYKNTVREGRGFTTLTTPWSDQVALDANGWPTAGFTVINWEGGILPGWATAATITTPFKCGYIGTGTPTAWNGATTVGNIVMGNGTTTYTTFDMYNILGTGGFQVSSGATNVFAYMPAYPGSAIDDRTLLSSLTPEWLGIWENVALMRFMWAGNLPNNTTLCTSTTRRSFANTQAYQSWASLGTEGYPAEMAVYLCKYAGIGLWFCLPVWEDGVNNAAGTYTTAILNLINSVFVPTGKPVRFEIGNELWNPIYPQNFFGGLLTTLAVNNGFASSMSDFAGSENYLAYKYHQLAVACRAVFGANFGPGKQVQIVMPSQTQGPGYGSQFPQMLNYLQTNFGTPSADVQNLAIAPYMQLTNNSGDTSTALVLADLGAVAPVQAYNSGAEQVSILAGHYGMHFCLYEGQWEVNTEPTNSFITPALQSTAITPILETWAQTCIDTGAEFPLCWFEMGCSQSNSPGSPTDELSNDWGALVTTGSPQLAAIQSVALGTYTPQRNVIQNSGDSILAGNYAGSIGGAVINLQTFSAALGFSFSCAQFQFYCPVAITRTISVTVSGTVVVSIEMDAVIIASGVTLNAGLNSIGSFALAKGKHYIVIGCNSFPASITVGTSPTGPAVTFT
jgi:hypothetical protein